MRNGAPKWPVPTSALPQFFCAPWLTANPLERGPLGWGKERLGCGRMRDRRLVNSGDAAFGLGMVFEQFRAGLDLALDALEDRAECRRVSTDLGHQADAVKIGRSLDVSRVCRLQHATG